MPRAHLARSASVRLPDDPEGPTFPREEHDVPGLHLEHLGADELGGHVDGGGLEDDVLRSDGQRGVGRGQLDRELGQHPMAVVAARGAERLPQRRQVGRVDDLELGLGHLLEPLGRRADADTLSLGEGDDAVLPMILGRGYASASCLAGLHSRTSCGSAPWPPPAGSPAAAVSAGSHRRGGRARTPRSGTLRPSA